jgi:anthranilate synthase component 2
MIFMLDNYDSFTYNLVQYLSELGAEVVVRRNDAVTVDEVAALHPDAIVISPGPCTPREAGISVPLIQRLASTVPTLGVCLGHQAIGAALGGRVIRAKTQMHGKTDVITTDRRGVYHALPERFTVIRYHSLVIERDSLPGELEITATSEDGEIMGVRHTALAGTKTPLEGVQFHPESILTEHGHAMLKNFLEYRA